MPDTPQHRPLYLTRNISILRQITNLSKKNIAALLHISIHSLTKLENGKIPPRMSYEVLLHIYEHFHILPDTMLFEPLDK